MEFVLLLLKYLNFKDNGGARTSFQIKQVYDLLIYTVDLFSNKLNKYQDKNNKQKNDKNKKIENHIQPELNKKDFSYNKYLSYDKFKMILATITSRLKEKNNENIKDSMKSNDNNKDNKILYQCIFNFLHKLFFFMKKNKVASSTDDISNFNKSIAFIINSSKVIIKEIPDLKAMNEKLLDIEENLSK